MSDVIVSRNPRTGDVVGEVAATPPGDLAAVVARSRKAFEEWSRLLHRDRRQLLIGLKRVMLRRGEEIAATVHAEAGKPLTDAYAYDVLTSLTVLDHYARNAERYLRPRKASSWPFLSTRAWTEQHPRGVVGVISPWNYPFFLPVIPTVSALAAGCSVVLKPSEITPLSGQWLADLVAEAGLPSDLVQVVHGAGDVGAALVDSGIDAVAFTGSTRVGRKVAEAASRQGIPVNLELGGNDAMVVLDDARLRQAARAAVWAGMMNAGQTCVAVERVIVTQAVYEPFLSELERALEHVAASDDRRREIGPIIHAPQLETIERHVDDAIARGARVLAGGQRVDTGGGLTYLPTVLVDVDPSSEILSEETFGPVIVVQRVPDEDAALETANATSYGLHGSVWTRDTDRGAAFASRMATGTVAVNDVTANFIAPSVTFGGIGDSGPGVALGPEGLRFYTYPKGITAARLPWPTTRLLGAWFPRRWGMRYWRTLARLLHRW